MVSAQAYDEESVTGADLLRLEKRYGEGRAKRLGGDEGTVQLVDISLSKRVSTLCRETLTVLASGQNVLFCPPNMILSSGILIEYH